MSESGSSARSESPDWYDREESEKNFEHPKYWDQDEVVVGIKQLLTPIKLDTLCGTYHWFYEFPEPGVSDPQDVFYPKSVLDPEGPGYLSITCPHGENATLENISGTVVHFGKEAQFSGLRCAKDRSNNLLDNFWEFVEFKWKENYGDNLDHDNALLALGVCDDDGEPFVTFRYASPGRMGNWYLDIAAKKQRNISDRCKLTTAEMERLGMEAQYPEVRAAAEAEAEAESDSESGTEAEAEVGSKSAGKRKLTPVTDEEEDARPKKRKET
ncbi:hypothetical protein C8J57DRAFT_1286950 [Mycena rebaudengoi]|nr:hypothetical protein C8J57DRAFT_1286950 [Mycena rebaudengoi]